MKNLLLKVVAFLVGVVCLTAFGGLIWVGYRVLNWIGTHLKHWILSSPGIQSSVEIFMIGLFIVGLGFMAITFVHFAYGVGKEVIRAFKLARLCFKALPEIQEGKQVSIPLE